MDLIEKSDCVSANLGRQERASVERRLELVAAGVAVEREAQLRLRVALPHRATQVAHVPRGERTVVRGQYASIHELAHTARDVGRARSDLLIRPGREPEPHDAGSADADVVHGGRSVIGRFLQELVDDQAETERLAAAAGRTRENTLDAVAEQRSAQLQEEGLAIADHEVPHVVRAYRLDLTDPHERTREHGRRPLGLRERRRQRGDPLLVSADQSAQNGDALSITRAVESSRKEQLHGLADQAGGWV